MKASLTAFSKFVGATATAKVAVVSGIKHAPKYDPAHDYWKGPREVIPRNHAAGGTKKDLDDFVAGVTSNRADNYELRVDAYKRWWGKKVIKSLAGSSSTWKSGQLEVTVTPELFVSINGVSHVIKLYFNKEKMSVDRANAVLRLLELTYRKGASPTGSPTVGVLDLGQGKLIVPTKSLAYLDAVLLGEAASFSAMWKAL